MDRPIAFKLAGAQTTQAYRISLDPALAQTLPRPSECPRPAIVVARRVEILAAMSTGVLDATGVVAVSDGDWTSTILISLPEVPARAPDAESPQRGDTEFLQRVRLDAPGIFELASKTLEAIRGAGVDGELVEDASGRWVNRPTNTFTLKAQPRAGNLHFTLYGNPESYEADGFLRRDQNSYSRGWVRTVDDVQRLAALTRLSHSRRRR